VCDVELSVSALRQKSRSMRACRVLEFVFKPSADIGVFPGMTGKSGTIQLAEKRATQVSGLASTEGRRAKTIRHCKRLATFVLDLVNYSGFVSTKMLTQCGLCARQRAATQDGSADSANGLVIGDSHVAALQFLLDGHFRDDGNAHSRTDHAQ
jgi:hypothetical protein